MKRIEKWIKDYVEGETTVARAQVQDTETAIMQVLEAVTTAGNAEEPTKKPATTIEDILNAIGESLSDLASSNVEQNGEHEESDDEDPEHGRLGDDDEPCRVMGTISKSVQHRMESFQ
jgi:hypothetical protein